MRHASNVLGKQGSQMRTQTLRYAGNALRKQCERIGGDERGFGPDGRALGGDGRGLVATKEERWCENGKAGAGGKPNTTAQSHSRSYSATAHSQPWPTCVGTVPYRQHSWLRTLTRASTARPVTAQSCLHPYCHMDL
jgi:hypothetical protein